MVQTQLTAAGVAQPRRWHAYRTFVLGYVDALTGLHAEKGGRRPDGPESRELCASVLRGLCGEPHADVLIGELADAFVRASREFTLGQRSALDDYDRWSERDMCGIENFIESAHAELLRLVPQPELEPVTALLARNAPLG